MYQFSPAASRNCFPRSAGLRPGPISRDHLAGSETGAPGFNVSAPSQNDSPWFQLFPYQVNNHVQPRNPRRGVDLHHEREIVAVKHQAGPAVTFSIDQPVARRSLIEKTLSPFDRFGQPGREPGSIDYLRLPRMQNPNPNWRIGIKQSDCKKPVLPIVDN